MGWGSPRSAGLRLEPTGLNRRPGGCSLGTRVAPGGARPVQRSGPFRGGGSGSVHGGGLRSSPMAVPFHVPENRPSGPWLGGVPAETPGPAWGNRPREGGRRERPSGTEPRPGRHGITAGGWGGGAAWAAACATVRTAWLSRPDGACCSRDLGLCRSGQSTPMFTEHLLCARPRPAVQDTKVDEVQPRPCTRSWPVGLHCPRQARLARGGPRSTVRSQAWRGLAGQVPGGPALGAEGGSGPALLQVALWPWPPVTLSPRSLPASRRLAVPASRGCVISAPGRLALRAGPERRTVGAWRLCADGKSHPRSPWPLSGAATAAGRRPVPLPAPSRAESGCRENVTLHRLTLVLSGLGPPGGGQARVEAAGLRASQHSS